MSYVLGDVVGDTGRAVLQAHIDDLVKKHRIDAVIVNGENSAHEGTGYNSSYCRFF